MLAIDLLKATDRCAGMIEYVISVSGGMSMKDSRIFNRDWNMIEDPVKNYFAQQDEATMREIFKAIHVEESTKAPIFHMNSHEVSDAFIYDKLIDYSTYVEALIAAKSPVLIYAGEYDS